MILATLSTARTAIVDLLQARGAHVVDFFGRLLPEVVLLNYHRQGVLLAVTDGGEPNERQRQAMSTAIDGGWFALAVQTPEQVGALLDALDYARKTGRCHDRTT